MQNVGEGRARDAERVDAEVLIEAPVLDRDEGVRQVFRQRAERDRRAGEIAAAGERLAVQIDDVDARRTLGNFQRLNGRQMRADPGDASGRADDEPAPGPNRPTATAMAGARASSLPSLSPAVWRRPSAAHLRAPAAPNRARTPVVKT
jgi:hypothetical protein